MKPGPGLELSRCENCEDDWTLTPCTVTRLGQNNMQLITMFLVYCSSILLVFTGVIKKNLVN